VAGVLAGAARVIRALFTVCILACATSAFAVPGVRGVVRTLQSPLEGVHVVILEAGRFAETDSLGRYDLGALAPGLYGVTIVAIGYESASGTITVRADSSADAADWLLKPLRPDGGGVGSFPRTPAYAISDSIQLGMRRADSLLADSLTRLPGPPPLAAPIGFFLTPEEQAAEAQFPGALGELLPQIATSDSITNLGGGTGAPGVESWRQWSEHLASQAADTLSEAGAIARRALAYTRTRGALADGATWNGWQTSKLARSAITAARRDVARGRPGGPFLDEIEGRLDAVFVPGQEPARPKPAPAKRSRHKKKRT
jgi:hypothetical protein